MNYRNFRVKNEECENILKPETVQFIALPNAILNVNQSTFSAFIAKLFRKIWMT